MFFKFGRSRFTNGAHDLPTTMFLFAFKCVHLVKKKSVYRWCTMVYIGMSHYPEMLTPMQRNEGFRVLYVGCTDDVPMMYKIKAEAGLIFFFFYILNVLVLV